MDTYIVFVGNGFYTEIKSEVADCVYVVYVGLDETEAKETVDAINVGASEPFWLETENDYQHKSNLIP